MTMSKDYEFRILGVTIKVQDTRGNLSYGGVARSTTWGFYSLPDILRVKTIGELKKLLALLEGEGTK